MKDHHTTKPKHGDGEKESTNRHVYLEPGAKIDFVRGIREQYETAQIDDKTYKAEQLVWTKIAAGLLLLAAGFSGWQGYLTRKAIRDAREHFIKDQRPYLWHSLLKFNLQDRPTNRLAAAVFFNNYGKSPAINRKGRGQVFFGPNALDRAQKWFDDLGNTRFTENETGSETIEPPGVDPLPDPEKPRGGYTTLMSDSIPTTEDVTYIRSHNDSVIIVEREQYFDLAGNFYWSDMCWSSLRTGVFYECRHHNELH